jgi:hypothetical protein
MTISFCQHKHVSPCGHSANERCVCQFLSRMSQSTNKHLLQQLCTTETLPIMHHLVSFCAHISESTLHSQAACIESTLHSQAACISHQHRSDTADSDGLLAQLVGHCTVQYTRLLRLYGPRSHRLQDSHAYAGTINRLCVAQHRHHGRRNRHQAQPKNRLPNPRALWRTNDKHRDCMTPPV